MALASSLASNAFQNAHAQQGYPAPPQSGGSGVLGSILGALGIVYLYRASEKYYETEISR